MSDLVCTVKCCARCGGTHENLSFRKYTHPQDDINKYDHWATCPTVNEPILLAIVGDESVMIQIDEDDLAEKP